MINKAIHSRQVNTVNTVNTPGPLRRGEIARKAGLFRTFRPGDRFPVGFYSAEHTENGL
jgi:hypothetical protein